MTVRIFTLRRVAGSIVVGVTASSFLSLLHDVPWRLSGLTGLAVGACALAAVVVRAYPRFDMMTSEVARSHPGVAALAGLVIFVPPVLSTSALPLNRTIQFTFCLLLLLTGCVAYVLGGIMGTLRHLDGGVAAKDPRRPDLSAMGGRLCLFTVGRTAFGVTTGAILAALTSRHGWNLAASVGLVTGGWALSFASATGAGLFKDWHGPRHYGVWLLVCLVAGAPALLVTGALFSWEDRIGMNPPPYVALYMPLYTLFLAGSFTAYYLGCMMGTLKQRDY